MARRWTKDEINYLKEHYTEQSDTEIGDKFGRTKDAVAQKRRQYRLVNLSYRWSEEEIEMLKQNYNKTPKRIGEMIDRTPKAIKDKKRSISRQTSHCVDCGEEDPEFYVDSEGKRWNLCVDCVKDIIPEFF